MLGSVEAATSKVKVRNVVIVRTPHALNKRKNLSIAYVKK